MYIIAAKGLELAKLFNITVVTMFSIPGRKPKRLLKQALFILFSCVFASAAFAQQAPAAKRVAPPSASALTKGQATRIDSQQELLKEQSEAIRDLRKTIDSLVIRDTEPHDAAAEAQKTLDRAVGILSSVSTNISMLVMLIVTLISVTVAAGIPISLYFLTRWRQRDKETKKAERYIAERYAGELGARITIPPLEKEPTAEVKKELDELSQRLKHVERLGGSLSADDYFKRGSNLYYKGDYRSALEAFEKAIELKPDYAETWFNKGVILHKLGRHEEELRAYERAIELKPDDAGAWNNKGVALGKLGRHGESLRAFERVVEIKPDDADSWSNKGNVLGRLGRYDEALEACSKAIEIKPDYAAAWCNRAWVYTLMKRKQEALSDLKRAIELDASYKEKAKKDEDFESLWEDEDFKKLVE